MGKKKERWRRKTRWIALVACHAGVLRRPPLCNAARCFTVKQKEGGVGGGRARRRGRKRGKKKWPLRGEGSQSLM